MSAEPREITYRGKIIAEQGGRETVELERLYEHRDKSGAISFSYFTAREEKLLIYRRTGKEYLEIRKDFLDSVGESMIRKLAEKAGNIPVESLDEERKRPLT